MDVLIQHFNEGGLFMWPILVVGIVVIGIVGERSYVLFFKALNRKDEFTREMRKLILSGNFVKAVKLANTENSPLSRIVKAGLLQVRRTDDVIQSTMDEAALLEVPYLERRTGYLAMLSNVATLAGLLGTVVGLIHSFGAVAKADAATKSTLLAAGISEAMNCTAFGLIVAIPALLAFAVLQSRTQKCVDEINEGSVRIVNLILLNRDKLLANEQNNG
ncbi:MotA/TolQ/ExbB proton channel family protein [Myxococcota bacterium]|jgi:biopolymer transport protein ExbB/TolQ|nr:MotA/TolQ/ExbB proton channel family protein [Myxococcota bacterium]